MKKSYTLFTGLVLLAASLVFTGCENFLSGNNLKKELEEKIQYEKKPAYTISVELEKAEYGQCNLNTFELKEGESKALTFTLGSGYNFKYWKCNDPEAIEFSPENSAKTTVTLKKGKTDLIITPVCAEVFGVKNILPEKKDGGVPRDSPIILTFTHSIKPESLGTIGDDYKILIAKEDGTDLSEFYGAPVFSENNTVVKFPAIREKPVIENGTSNIEVIVKAGIESEAGETIADKYSYKFKVNSSRDSDAPLFIDFKVTSKKPSFNQTLETLSEEYDSFKDKITIDGETLITEIPDSSNYKVSEQFHIKDKLYIYCKAEDKGSGAYRLECDSISCDSISFPTAESGKKFVLTSENIYEIDDCEIDLSSYPDGEIELTFKLYDYCNNVCPDTKVYKVIKDTKIEQDDFYICNEYSNDTFPFNTTIVDTANYNPVDGISNNNTKRTAVFIQTEDFEKCARTFYIYGLHTDNWADISETLTAGKNVKIEYIINGISYEAEIVDDSEFYLNKVVLGSDIKLKATVSDSVGNEFSKEYYYPTGTIDVDYNLYGDCLSIDAKKTDINAGTVSFRYFYDFCWDNEVIETFNNLETTKNSITQIETLYEQNKSECWGWNLNPSKWRENAAIALLNILGVQSNTNYKVSFDTYDTIVSYSGPNKSNMVLYSTYVQNLYAHSNQIYLDKLKKLGFDFVNITIVPEYHFGNNIIYGLPQTKNISIIDIDGSNEYELTFSLSPMSSCGAGTGKCQIEVDNVIIRDLSGNNCTSDFDIQYFYKKGLDCIYTEKSNIIFDSVSSDSDAKIGVKAINKTNKSLLLKAEQTAELTAIDNFVPEFTVDKDATGSSGYGTLSLYDYDLTGQKMYIGLQTFKCNQNSSYQWVYSNYGCILQDRIGTTAVEVVPFRNDSGDYEFKYSWYKWNEYKWGNFGSKLPVIDTSSDVPVSSGVSTMHLEYPIDTKRNSNNKMWIPVNDMSDGKYVLAVEITDINGNSFFETITFHEVNTYSNPLSITTNNGLLTISQGYTDSENRWDTGLNFGTKNGHFATVQMFNGSDWYIKHENIELNSRSNNFTVDLDITDSGFIKCSVLGASLPYLQRTSLGKNLLGTVVYKANLDASGRGTNTGTWNMDKYRVDYAIGEINSAPSYIYIGSDTCNLYNMIEGSAGISIITDGPVLIHTLYSTREEGYGDNIDEWERRAREWNPVQINKNSNYTGYKNLPSDAKSYVVVAYFANGERVISSVYHKE